MDILDKDNQEAQQKESFKETHRRRLGIPDSLKSKPVLYVSSHRGFFDTQIPGHLELFKMTLTGEESDYSEDKESTYLDLSKVEPDEVVDTLKEYILRCDPSTNSEKLLFSGSKDVVPPGFTINVVYLPQLDNKGKSKEGSHTFAIDAANYRNTLRKLSLFLDDKGILDNPT